MAKEDFWVSYTTVDKVSIPFSSWAKVKTYMYVTLLATSIKFVTGHWFRNIKEYLFSLSSIWLAQAHGFGPMQCHEIVKLFFFSCRPGGTCHSIRSAGFRSAGWKCAKAMEACLTWRWCVIIVGLVLPILWARRGLPVAITGSSVRHIRYWEIMLVEVQVGVVVVWGSKRESRLKQSRRVITTCQGWVNQYTLVEFWRWTQGLPRRREEV